MTRTVAVIVASTRAAAGTYSDTTGPAIAGWATDHGWQVVVHVVPDGDEVGAALRAALADGVDLIVTTGGTGLSPSDVTPEHTRAVVEREVPGIAEELRRRGASSTPLAALSRGIAGVSGHTLIVNLPGSAGGVRDGLAVLDSLVEHVWDQFDGGDHGTTRGTDAELS